MIVFLFLYRSPVLKKGIKDILKVFRDKRDPTRVKIIHSRKKKKKNRDIFPGIILSLRE